MRGRRATAFCTLIASLAGAAGAARAQGLDPALDRCVGETATRLRFLEERLQAHQRYANRWVLGWGTVYVGGMVVEGTRAGFEDDRGERANQVVNAVKSGIGLTRDIVLDPPHARHGARELTAMPTATPADCQQRLARAEQLVQDLAQDAREERKSWIPHLGNLALNLVGAVIVAEGFDEPAGWASGAIGFAVGEVRIWTFPWQAEGTWQEYQRRFPRTTSDGPRWSIEPFHTGARVRVTF
jgi:hypothetical protein